LNPVLQIFLPIAEMPVDLFLVIAMGAAVGFISGLFGIGGGFLMTPFLIFIGVPASVAVATGSMQIAASSTTGVMNYWRRKSIDLRLALVLTAGGFIGSILGVLFFNQMKRVGQLDLIIQLCYVTLMLTIGGFMIVDFLRSLWRNRDGAVVLRPKGAPDWAKNLPLQMTFERSQFTISVIPLVALGLVIGFLGALMGIGGGFMTVPALIYLFRVPTAVVVGTSMLQILVTTLAATMLHALTNGQVDILLGLVLTLGGVIGAQFGTRAGRNLNGDYFRFLLALLVLAVGMRFAIGLVATPDDLYSLLPGGL
jgi:uncharacterized protein